MSSSESLTTCPWCGAHLRTEGLAGDATLVCARCRHMFEFRPVGDMRKISRKAIASLALGLIAAVFACFLAVARAPGRVGPAMGLIAAVFSCLAALPGVVLGVMALAEISRPGEHLKGRTMAKAGIAASCLGAIGAVVFWALLLPIIQAIRHTG